MKIKLTLQNQAGLFALFAAFQNLIDFAPDSEAKEMQTTYDEFRREILEYFRCEQCQQIYWAGDEFEDFVCNICAHNNADRHLADVVDLEQWIARNK